MPLKQFLKSFSWKKTVVENDKESEPCTSEFKGNVWRVMDKRRGWEKSIIDFVIAKAEDIKDIKLMLIDNKGQFPVYRLIKEKKKTRKVFSDHYSIIVKSNILQETDNVQYRHNISPKGYREFEKKLRERKVSQLLIGQNYCIICF